MWLHGRTLNYSLRALALLFLFYTTIMHANDKPLVIQPSQHDRTTAEKLRELELKNIQREAAMDKRAEAAAADCIAVFGKDVNFRQKELGDVLGLVAPVPVTRRQSMEGKRLDDRLTAWQSTAFSGEWFAEKWRPDADQTRPVAFHFRSPERLLLDSTLYYKWQRQTIEFRATVSSSGALVEIRDPTSDLQRGVPRRKLELLLKDVFGIPDKVAMELGTSELTPLDLAKVLKLPEIIQKGAIFGSLEDRMVLNTPFLWWYLATKGFATDECVCIAVWRPNNGGHLGQKGLSLPWVGGYGHFEDPAWLNTAIFEADGKTLVKPPALGLNKDE